jgi:hypothetical protein
MRNEDIMRKLGALNIVGKKDERSIQLGFHLSDIDTKSFSIQLVENETLVAHERDGGTK